MGVHGLHSYVDKTGTGVRKVLILHETVTDQPIPFVVDGLAFLYAIARVDCLLGGSYSLIRESVERYIKYWRVVGLQPIFVFDGPSDASKLQTRYDRTAQSIESAVAYMVAPDWLRLTPAVTNKAQKLPPLCLDAVLDKLEELEVEFWVAEGEADARTAELAQRLNGFMVSSGACWAFPSRRAEKLNVNLPWIPDSDYFIFPSNCRGYVPLEGIQYGPVGERRLDWKSPSPSPPEVRLEVYHHTAVAELFSIPPSFLPVFASLVGNDLVDLAHEFKLPSDSKKKYSGFVDGTTMNRIALHLASFTSLPAQTPDQVLHLLHQVVPVLLREAGRTSPLSSTEYASLLTANSSYNLISLDVSSPDHPLYPQTADNSVPHRAIVRDLYAKAQKKGRFGTVLAHILMHGITFPPVMVEDPQRQSPVVSLGSPIRMWIYAILDEGVGLGRDVIIECVRRGHQLNLAQVRVVSRNFWASYSSGPSAAYLQSTSSCPIALASTESKLRLLFLALRCPFPSTGLSPTSLLSEPLFPLVLALRHVQQMLSVSLRWTTFEIESALLAGLLLSLHTPGTPLPLVTATGKALPSKHTISLASTLVTVLFHLQLLADVLLLDKADFSMSWRMYDGRLFSRLLDIGEEGLATVVNDGLDENARIRWAGMVRSVEGNGVDTEGTGTI